MDKTHLSRNLENQGTTLSAASNYQDFYESLLGPLRGGGTDGNCSAFCPLHGEVAGESKPSLSVNVETGLWYCFAGCGGGTAKTFLRELEYNRSEIDRLTSRLPRPGVRKRRKITRVGGQIVLPEMLLGVFQKCRIELIDAGFCERVLYDHDIGFDDDYGRITFPVRTKTGQLVGIVGRQKDTRYGKYKVYTKELRKYGFNVESFPKGDYLWREGKAAAALGRNGDLYVVEGFKAALWFAQSGVDTVVALMGSKLSERQQKSLISYGKRIILCLDNDDAGQKATLEICHKLRGTRRYIVPLPEGIKQPDDLSEFELLDQIQTPINLSEARKRWQRSL